MIMLAMIYLTPCHLVEDITAQAFGAVKVKEEDTDKHQLNASRVKRTWKWFIGDGLKHKHDKPPL